MKKMTKDMIVNDLIENMVKEENEMYHCLQFLIKDEDDIDARFYNAFDDWLEVYGKYCPEDPISFDICEYIGDAAERVSTKKVKEMCDYWIECIENRIF
jgi:hypothetical protein